MLENDLNEFIVVYKKNHFLYHLKKDIRERLQMMTNISITRNRLVTLTQRIKNSQTLKTDSRNKFQNDWNLNFELRSKSTKQRSRRNDTMSNQTNKIDNSISKNRSNEIAKLFLRQTDEQSNDFKNKKICYNCDKKKHIINKCFTFKQKNLQINIIKNFRQNIQIDVEKTLLIYFITEVFDELKN